MQRLKSASKAFLCGSSLLLCGLTSTPQLYARTNAAVENNSVVQDKAITVKGTVIDEHGEPLVAAVVKVQGNPTKGAYVAADGSFSIAGVHIGDVLEITSIGYKAQQYKISSVKAIHIRMEPDSQMLQEVVVTGYGTQKKESLTGSLQVIKSESLKDVTTPNLANMLNGKAPGVMVASASGRPGDVGAIIIRGKSTINGSTAPLWVIDGVIVGNSPGDLNPSDVESMSVLKDAASTAIYGSQGANGVILVTTKSAKTGDVRMTFSSRLGATRLNNGNLQVMNGEELYDYYKSFSNSDQIKFPRWNEELRNSNFSWWDLATRTGLAQDYNFSVSGGNEQMKSLLSVGIYDESGAVKGFQYTRYNFRLKNEFKLNDYITIKPSVSGSRRDVDDQQYSVGAMYSNLPWDSPYKEDGSLVEPRSSLWVNNTGVNYLYDLQWNKSDSRTNEFMGNFDFDIRINRWLTFASVNNYKWSEYSSHSYEDPRSSGAEGVKGRIGEYKQETERRYTNQLLRFNRSFAKHNVNALLGYEFNDYKGRTLSANGTGFIPGFEVLDVVAKPEKVKGGIWEWAVQSYFFKANYDYSNKYYAELSFRRDGASNFGDNAKYGNFFSLSGAWNLANENWFHSDKVDLLKLRASYGSVGNRPNALYPQYDLYSVSGSYNEVPGALISQIGNKDLTWERTYATGLGLDAAFFGRLRFTLDLYNKNTDNLLYAVPVTGLVGVTSIWRNVGELENRGIEFSIGYDILKSKDWDWSVDFNMGSNKNKVKKLYGEKARIIVGDGLGIAGSADKLLEPGLDSDSFYMREWAGVNPKTGAPQWYTTDDKGERVVTESYAKADQVVVGTGTPKFFGGLFSGLRYKNLYLNASFNFSYGGKIYNYSRTEYDSDGAYTDRNQMKLMKGWSRWQKEGDQATHPKAEYENKSGSNKASSRFLEDGSFFKLRSLSVAYDVPVKKIPHIRNLRLSLTGENLLTFTKYSGVDPEIPPHNGSVIGSAGPSIYPSTRKVVAGLSITF